MENEDFKDVLENRDGRFLFVKFGASWCGPCKIIQPMLETLAGLYEETCDFYAIDVDDDPDIANVYSIRSVPTMLLFSPTGKVLGKLVGRQTFQEMRAFVKNRIRK